MAKLYWRVKINGRWTWRAAQELYAMRDSKKRTVQYTLKMLEDDDND
ncbi:MAG: hypothetical protein ACPH9F_08105 [Candidatus Poseidoniaceae archaeon]